MSRIVVVDKNNEEIGVKERELINENDVFRVTALWITNSRGEILLAKRSKNKDSAPDKWGPAVAGTVEEAETYETNIYKEAKEEIGVEGFEFLPGEIFFNDKIDRKYFTKWFYLELDRNVEDFKVDSLEVGEIKWFKKEELKELIKANPSDYLDSVKRKAEL